jgi:hypothetical protein
LTGGSPGPSGGEAIVRASWIGTGAFALSAVGAVLVPAVRGPAAAIAVVLFAAGTGAFLVAYAIAVGRSRSEAIAVAALFFLTGATAPSDVRRQLMGALAVQVAVALATAAARPFSSLAYGTLAPVFGLGLAGLWGARHGSFGPRSGAER